MPAAAAPSSSSRLTAGPWPKPPPPPPAPPGARRISASGLVTVSLRRSIRSIGRFPSRFASESDPDPYRGLHRLPLLHLDVDLGEEQVEGHPGVEHRARRGIAARGAERGIEGPLAVDDAGAHVGGGEPESL